ncbi:hypothetical protein C3489_12855 [Streptomyces sp. Ru71]|uniref:DUF6578 domain-containing protein n=1 Tax=Streptomyces sp. Ru71 TaxID=2080746 RepID=UPI000CDD7A28|nr:DUF6578 domain-containing protein [Streptomyces sp. Ru71]POX54775.1 hypothetical protein C3489_12855 [Streptomyces sp. Ru71]
MGLWHVYYEGWQLECCGTPFAPGEEVSWPLLLNDAEDVLCGGWHDQLTKITGTVEDVPDGEDEEDGEGGTVRVVREETGLVVALPGDPDEPGRSAPGDWIRLVGLLTAESHGDGGPETTGTVRAVQLLRQGYAPSGTGVWVPVPGERSLHPVPRSPRGFAGGEVGADGVLRNEAGVMVTLEVPGTDSWLSYAVREARGIPHDRAGSGAETAGLTAEALASLLHSLSTVPARS